MNNVWKPWTEAMWRAIQEYESDGERCCESCGRTARGPEQQTAFAHGWKKAMKLAHELAGKFDREELLPALRAHGDIKE